MVPDTRVGLSSYGRQYSSAPRSPTEYLWQNLSLCPRLSTDDNDALARQIGAPRVMFRLLRTTLPRITRSAPFPPVSSKGARRCREPVSLPISTTEETHKTLDIGLGLWPLSHLYIMRWCTCSLYRDVRPLRGRYLST
jgi:hypothetical protein